VQLDPIRIIATFTLVRSILSNLLTFHLCFRLAHTALIRTTSLVTDLAPDGT